MTVNFLYVLSVVAKKKLMKGVGKTNDESKFVFTHSFYHINVSLASKGGPPYRLKPQFYMKFLFCYRSECIYGSFGCSYRFEEATNSWLIARKVRKEGKPLECLMLLFG